MAKRAWRRKLIWVGVLSIIGLFGHALIGQAAVPPNTVTFDNQSGEPALVKLVGPSSQAVAVQNGQESTVPVEAGDYYIMVQYGNEAQGYRFTQGDPFTVLKTARRYSTIAITLHPVIAGNYETEPISQAEFERAQVAGRGQAPASPPPVPQSPDHQTGSLRTITGKDGAPMVLIPKGEFWMGTTYEEAAKLIQKCVSAYITREICEGFYEGETPQHRVVLDSFYLDQYEVTNRRFAAFVRVTGHRTDAEKEGFAETYVRRYGEWQEDVVDGAFWRKPDGVQTVLASNRADHPVVQISWNDARAYCKKVGKRLPTEAEFEYANRSGTDTPYWWGKGNPGSRLVANILDEAAKRQFTHWKNIMTGYDDGYATTAPVGAYEANPWGLYDLAGNVGEWTADWYGAGYYQRSPEKNPTGPSHGSSRVLRGGSWHNSADSIRSANRDRGTLGYRDVNIGFRCAKTP